MNIYRYVCIAVTALLVGCAVPPHPDSTAISIAAAQQVLARAERHAQARNFQALCELGDFVRMCEQELQTQGVRAAVPHESARLIDTYILPKNGQFSGGRVLVIEGVDGNGTPYHTEVLVHYGQAGHLTLLMPIYWTGTTVADELGT